MRRQNLRKNVFKFRALSSIMLLKIEEVLKYKGEAKDEVKNEINIFKLRNYNACIRRNHELYVH